MKRNARRGNKRDQRMNVLIEEEALIQGVANAIGSMLEKKKISRKALAERLGVTPPNITQILRGDNNLKLKTVARMAYALGMRLTVSMEPLRVRRPSIVTDRWEHHGGSPEWPQPTLKIAGRR